MGTRTDWAEGGEGTFSMMARKVEGARGSHWEKMERRRLRESLERRSCGRTLIEREATILSTLIGLLGGGRSTVNFLRFEKKEGESENLLVENDAIVNGPNVLEDELNEEGLQFLPTRFHLLPIHHPLQLGIEVPVPPQAAIQVGFAHP